MSYILDALKKAERERGIAQLPSMTYARDFRGARRNRVAVAAVGLAVCIAVLLLLLLPARRAIVRPPERAPAEAEQNRPAHASGTGTAGQPAPPLPSTPPAHSAPTHSQIVRAPNHSAARPQSTPVAAPPSGAGTADREETAHHPPANDPSAGRLTSSDAVSRKKTPENPALPPPENASQQPIPGAETKGGAAVSVDTQAKPLPLQEAMAKMTLNILVYDDEEAARRVVINGRKYVKGDYVDGHYLIESITLEGAVLSYDGQRATLRPR